MPPTGVRVSAQTRRKPRQSRAKASSEALQEAFVRVLIDKGYAGVTVREVAAVAGVGIGTFYEYVANKEALAALTIHLRVKTLAQALQSCAQAQAGHTPWSMVQAMMHELIDRVQADAISWAALFMLERQISDPEVYRKHYEQFVNLWLQGLQAATPAIPTDQQATVARMVHSLVYGWVTQCLLTQGPQLDWAQVRDACTQAVRAYLSTITLAADL